VTPETLSLLAAVAVGAALVLAGQWCAAANRRRLERDRLARRWQQALRQPPALINVERVAGRNVRAVPPTGPRALRERP
jgi:hypothetical protein